MGKRGIISNPIFIDGDSAYDVNASKNKPINASQIKKIVDRMNASRENHAKLCVIIFVLHSDVYTDNNEIWSKAIKLLEREVKDYYGELTLSEYFCVRERDKSDSQHYHLALVMNGKYLNRAFVVFKVLSKIWSELGGAKVTHIKTYNLSCKDEVLFRVIIFHLSYFAKLRTKENHGNSTRNFFVRRKKSM